MNWTDPGDLARFLVGFFSLLCVLELSLFLVNYWRVIYPIRVEIGQTVVAPPAVITLWYNLLVGALITCNMVGVCFSLARDIPVNPVIYPMVGVTMALTYVIGVFYKTYVVILKKAQETTHASGN